MRAAARLAALLLLAAGTAHADAPARLIVDGDARTLRGALQVTADGRVWIGQPDLESAFGVHAKRMIPRPPEASRRRRPLRRGNDAWILCGDAAFGTYRGEVQGAAQRSFDLHQAARALGYKVKTRGDALHVATSAKQPPRRARIGTRVGDIVLPDLDGTPHRLHGARGKRVLIVTWATWSQSRKDLEEWIAAWSRRARETTVLWFVAFDVEGASRVRDYAPTSDKVRVLVDRNADLLRRLNLNDAGHWFLIDELGILRAEFKRATETDRQWLDLHMEEALVEARPPPAANPRTVSLEILRERAQAEPDNVGARLALAERLEAEKSAEARKEIAALIALRPRSVPLAFRLTRMQLDAGDNNAALLVLDEARRRVPRIWMVRKQYWALEEPNRFYAGEIDLAWQKKRKKEEKWLDPHRRR